MSVPAKRMAYTAKSAWSVETTVSNRKGDDRGGGRSQWRLYTIGHRIVHIIICRVEVVSCRPPGARKPFRQKYGKKRLYSQMNP